MALSDLLRFFVFILQHKDYDAVDKILKHVMSMEQMTALSSGDIKKTLDSKNKLCYPLLQW